MAGLSAMKKSIRRGDGLTAQRALRTLHREDPSSTCRRLLIIAYEDVGIAARAVVIAATRCANSKALRETGRDEEAALVTAQMLAEAPKDRSADSLFAAVLRDPTPKTMRSRRRSVSIAWRPEFVADPTLSLPERALAAWQFSGVESRGEHRVGPGDLCALRRARRFPSSCLRPLPWRSRKPVSSSLCCRPCFGWRLPGVRLSSLNSPLAPLGSIKDVPLYALDKHTRLERQAIKRFAHENAKIAQLPTERGCGSGDDPAPRMPLFHADRALTRTTLRWRHAGEPAATGVAGDFHRVIITAAVGTELVQLVAAHIDDLKRHPQPTAELRRAGRLLMGQVICRLLGTTLRTHRRAQ
jgi:hypothetical protein